MIEPTVGRNVLFRPGRLAQNLRIHTDHKQPLVGLITFVHGSRLLNLAVFDALGRHHALTSVKLLQDDDKAEDGEPHAEWMPYQKGQAAKTEQLEAQAAKRIHSASDALANEVDLKQPALINPSHDFGFALLMLKQGHRVARAGWNGKGMWLALSCDGTREVPAAAFWAPPNREYAEANGGKATVLPSITMKTATGEILMGWLASQTDMLAEDWTIVE